MCVYFGLGWGRGKCLEDCDCCRLCDETGPRDGPGGIRLLEGLCPFASTKTPYTPSPLLFSFASCMSFPLLSFSFPPSIPITSSPSFSCLSFFSFFFPSLSLLLFLLPCLSSSAFFYFSFSSPHLSYSLLPIASSNLSPSALFASSSSAYFSLTSSLSPSIRPPSSPL